MKFFWKSDSQMKISKSSELEGKKRSYNETIRMINIFLHFFPV